jgi:hypothetical protein
MPDSFVGLDQHEAVVEHEVDVLLPGEAGDEPLAVLALDRHNPLLELGGEGDELVRIRPLYGRDHDLRGAELVQDLGELDDLGLVLGQQIHPREPGLGQRGEAASRGEDEERDAEHAPGPQGGDPREPAEEAVPHAVPPSSPGSAR